LFAKAFQASLVAMVDIADPGGAGMVKHASTRIIILVSKNTSEVAFCLFADVSIAPDMVIGS
jgi:hypothetical protein